MGRAVAFGAGIISGGLPTVLVSLLLLTAPVAGVVHPTQGGTTSAAAAPSASSSTEVGAAYSTCQTINGYRFCLQDVRASPTEVTPGETVTIEADVRNEGDTIGTIYSDLGVRPPGMDKRYPDNARAEIPVGETETIEFQYTVPESHPTGTYDVTVDIWTGDGSAMFQTSGWEPLFEVVEPTPEAEIDDVDYPSGDYTAGEDVTATVSVRNTGTTDHTFHVGYSVRGPDGEWRDNGGTTHEPVSVPAGRPDSVEVTWSVADDAPTGAYDVTVRVYAEERGGELLDPLDSRSSSGEFEVVADNSQPTLTRVAPDADVTIQAGQSVDFSAVAEDADGNLDGVDWTLDGRHQTTEAVGGSSDTADWSRTFDSAGTYTVSAEAVDEDGATSDTVSWTIAVEERTDVDALIRSYSFPSGTYRTGEPVSTRLTVENTGNTDHTFHVGYSVRGPDGEWRDNGGTTDESVSIPDGEDETIDVTWTAEGDAPTGAYDVVATVYAERSGDDLQNPRHSVDRDRAFEVVDGNDAPTASRAAPTREVTVAPDEPIEFRIDASDSDDDLDGSEWYVDGGLTDESRSIGGSSDTAVWSQSFDEPGTYTVAGVVFDAEGASSDSVRWDVTVESGNSAPTASRAAPTREVTVAPDEPIEFRIEARDADGNLDGSEWYRDGGLADESRSIGGSSDTAVESYAFDEPGTYTVEGVVFDAEGASSDSVRWDVTVTGENAAPAATRVDPGRSLTVSPDREITFELDAEDDDGNLARVEWAVDGSVVAEERSIEGSSDSDSWSRAFDSTGTYTVEATVVDATGAASDPVRWDVTVGGEEVSIDAFDVEERTYAPGETVRATATVENTGTTDRTVYVGYSLVGAGGTTYDGDGTTHVEVSVPPETERDVELAVPLPDDASPGTYDAVSSVWRENDGEVLAGRVDRRERSEAVTIRRASQPNAELVSLTTPQRSVSPGSTVTTTAVVRNTGDVEHAFFVGSSLVAPDGERFETDLTPTRSLAPGENTSVSMRWVVPESAPDGPYDVTVSIWQSRERRSPRDVLDESHREDAFQTGLPDDSFEPNDRLAAAAPLDTSRYDLTAGSDDIDFFTVSVEGGSELTVTTTAATSDQTALVLFVGATPKTRDTVDQTDSPGRKTVTATPEIDTTYYVAYRNSGEPTRYSIDVSTERVTGTDVLGTDRFEENDRPSAAADLSRGTTDGLTIRSSDPDFYALYYDEGHPITLDVTTEPGSEVIAVLTDPSGEVVGSVSSLSSGSTIDAAADTAGTYTLKVYSYEHKRVLYTVSYDEPGADQVDELEATTIEALESFGAPADEEISNQEYVLSYVVGFRGVERDDSLAFASGVSVGVAEAAEDIGAAVVNSPSETVSVVANAFLNPHETLAEVRRTAETALAFISDRGTRARVAYHVATEYDDRIEEYPTPYERSDKRAAYASGWIKGYALLNSVFVATQARNSVRSVRSVRDARAAANDDLGSVVLAAHVRTRTDSDDEAVRTLDSIETVLEDSPASRDDLETALRAANRLQFRFGRDHRAEDSGDLVDGLYATRLLQRRPDVTAVDSLDDVRTADGEYRPGTYLVHNVNVYAGDTKDGELDLVLVEVIPSADGGDPTPRVSTVVETTAGRDGPDAKFEQVSDTMTTIRRGGDDLSIGRGLERRHFERPDGGRPPITLVGPDGSADPTRSYDYEIEFTAAQMDDIDALIDDEGLIGAYRKKDRNDG